MSLKLVCLVLGGERSGLFTMNSRISLSNWSFHEKAQNMELKGVRRKSFEGYTLIYSHDLIAPRESLINLQKPAQTTLRIPPKEARKYEVFGGKNLWDNCWALNHGTNKFQGSQVN